MESGSILKWSIAEGTAFSAGDVIAEIQTDKATVDFEAQDDAVLAKILVLEGDEEISVGDPICVLVEDEEDVGAFLDFVPGEDGGGGGEKEVVSDDGVAAAPAPAVSAPAAPAVVSTPAPAPAVSTGGSTDGRVVASPLAHKLAKDLGVSIASMVGSGSGPNGRIIADDVREYVPPPSVGVEDAAAMNAVSMDASLSSVAAASGVAVSGAFSDATASMSQQQVAAALTAQKQDVPHYYLTVDVKLDSILALRSSGVIGDVSVNALLCKAAVCALQDCPVMNARWMDSFVRMYHEVALEYSLPGKSVVISNAASKGATHIDAVINEDEESSSTSAAVGTFTVVNLGMYGIKGAAPIIRPGQSGILGIGSAENVLVPSDVEGEEYATSVVSTATLSCDHRVVDGAVGAQWLAAFKKYVENPMSMIL